VTTRRPSNGARIAVVLGTRPEASKLAPVMQALQAHPSLDPWLLVTGQHREQLDAMLRVFDLRADADLNVMQASQSLHDLIARIVPAAADALRAADPTYVLVHGDTTTTFAVALAAHYHEIPVGHVEAGLRSHDLRQPFPEEANRRLTDVLTDLDLAPTAGAKGNLLREGKLAERIVVTGNTAVDAVRQVAQRVDTPVETKDGAPLVTITLHRRENLPVMAELAAAVADVARHFPSHRFVWPVHLNPAVRRAVEPRVEGVTNLVVTPPVDYPHMVAWLAASRLIVTDSGGLQEEGAALGVPVAVVRNVTERPEGVEVGALRILGNDPARVHSQLVAMLADDVELRAMRNAPNPYGDGRAAGRVVDAVAWRLGLGARPDDWLGPVLSSLA